MNLCLNWKKLLLFFLLLFVFVAIYSTTLPDNVKQEICSKKIEEGADWGMQMDAVSSITVKSYQSSLVGDLDGDGIPEIVTLQNSYASGHSGKIAVFQGNDISQSKIIDVGCYINYYAGASYGMVRLPDKASFGDTIGLIIVNTEYGLKSYKYENMSSISLFKENTTNVLSNGSVAFADFNNDGIPEVYTGNMVYDAYSLNLIAKGNSNKGQGYFQGNFENISYAADVLPSIPGTELICGSQIYSVNFSSNSLDLIKTISPPSGFVSDGQVAVADFDKDGQLDVLVKQNSDVFGIYAYNPRSSTILFSKQIRTGANRQGFPLIGDIDADSIPEVVVLSATTQETNSYMKAYKFDGTSFSEFWHLDVTDPSGSTGMTLFDFNQDGLKEIVYRDTKNLRIINGSLKSHLTGVDTTEVYDLSSFTAYSGTVAELPTVADCDADGEAEIIIPCKKQPTDLSGYLYVFESSSTTTWAPARKVWNQYAYNVTNVNEDLTIPSTLFNNATFFPNGKQPFNNFQEQATTINEDGDMFVPVFPDTIIIDTTIFKGQTITVDSKVYSEAVSDTIRLTNINNCDSTIFMTIQLDSIITEYSDTICEGSIYNFNGKMVSQPDIYRDTINLASGADSVVILNLTVLPSSVNNISERICEGDSYFFKNKNISITGEYRDTLVAASGCDSIVVLNLSKAESYEFSLLDTICAGGSYVFQGDVITEGGGYQKLYQTQFGCDSIYNLTLSVLSSDTVLIEKVISDDDFYFFAGMYLSEEGEYFDILQNKFGCDSVVILTLQSVEGNLELSVPEMFTPNGDGVNEFFEIKNLDNYPENRILILNRWGNTLYEASPYLNDWDGKAHYGVKAGNGLLPVGTYFYVLNLGDGSPVQKGYIYLSY